MTTSAQLPRGRHTSFSLDALIHAEIEREGQVRDFDIHTPTRIFAYVMNKGLGPTFLAYMAARVLGWDRATDTLMAGIFTFLAIGVLVVVGTVGFACVTGRSLEENDPRVDNRVDNRAEYRALALRCQPPFYPIALAPLTG